MKELLKVLKFNTADELIIGMQQAKADGYLAIWAPFEFKNELCLVVLKQEIPQQVPVQAVVETEKPVKKTKNKL